MGNEASNIRFTCSHCKTAHVLSRTTVSALPGSVTSCRTCKKSIKIAFCPKCGTSYSITFSSPMNRRYTLDCRQCGTSFPVEFPVIRGAIPKPSSPTMQSPEAGIATKQLHSVPPEKPPVIIEKAPERKLPAIQRSDHSLATVFLSFFSEVFSAQRLSIAAFAAAGVFILMAISVRAENMLLTVPLFRDSAFILHLLNFLTFFTFCFVLILSNTVMARLSIMGPAGGNMKPGEIVTFAISRALPVLVCNIAVLLTFNSLLIAFGSIPLVGPILYSLLFLPVYLLSVATVLLCAVAVWFYPPVLAIHGGILTSIREFFYFVRKQHFNLLITIPVLVILTAIFIALLNILHYSSLALAMNLSRGILGDDINRILSSMPYPASRILNIPHMIQGVKSLPSILGNLLFSYHAGGVILGAALGAISIALLSVILSFTGTLSARAYIILEQGREPGVGKKIEILAALLLVLAVLFMAKKVFL